MADRLSTRVAVVVLAVAAIMSGAVGLQITRERAYSLGAVNQRALYLTSGNALRRMAIGYTALAADVYWIRAIQYFGDIRLGRVLPVGGSTDEYPLLYQLLDLTTTLDPRFNIAYRFGSIFLAEPFPGGAGRPDQAIALLEKGLREVPDKWEYASDIGFVHYWWLHDYDQAAAWFERASRMPNAAWWLPSLRATTLVQGGDRASSRQVWGAIRESADNDWMRAYAERALNQLKALDEIDALQQLIDRIKQQTGKSPPSGNAIQSGGRMFVDPTGVPYEVDAAGRVGLGQKSSLFPLPNQPARLQSPNP